MTLDAEVARILDALPAGSDPRAAFAALGAEALFAVHYPRDLGGRGAGLAEYASVAEAIGERQLADEVHLVTVQGVGCTILRYGTDEQRHRWLPAIASGRTMASLLLSEVDAGSDAAAITTAAKKTATGWSLTGRKCWSLHADWSSLGLVSARTKESANRYSGITLFLVDLTSPGVTVSAVPRAMGESYFTVEFDAVELGDTDVLGTPDRGFSLVTAASGFERAGFDYLSRGRVWLRAARDLLAAAPELDTDRRRAALARLDFDLRAARALAQETVATAEGLELDYMRSAYSKYTSGEAAQAVARWIAEDLLPEPAVAAHPDLVRRLRTAVLEGPELSISGNAVDLLLDTLSLDPFLGAAQPGCADPAGDQVLAKAAKAVAAAERALVLARKRAGSRMVAGRPLIEFQSTGHRLAQAAARLALARIGVQLASRAAEPGVALAAGAAAAEAAFGASYALNQVYGAAGTSDPAPVAAFADCHAAAAALGPAAELWLEAGRHRT